MAQEELLHLSATEMRLSQALARPKLIAIGCVTALTALGWLSLAVMASGNVLVLQSWLLLCLAGAASGVAGLPVILAMWAAMVLR